MPTAAKPRILVVVFDALRPEFVTPDLMPNLHGFASRGVWYRNSHAAFFTETRVNQTTVTSGCMPQRHGIVANRFFDPDLDDNTPVNTGDDIQFEAAFAKAGGGLVHVPTLGEILASHGLRYATLSAGTSGGGRLINHSAERDGSFRYTMRRPDAAVPGDAHVRLTDAIGPIPDYDLPATAWISWAVDAYLDYMAPAIGADCTVLWLCEPDETFHKRGIGSPDARTTIHHVDAEFGRILAHHRGDLDAGALTIIAMSDHGQITLAGPPLDLVAHLNGAGFRAARMKTPDAEFVVVPGNAAGIWAMTTAAQERLPDLLCWLRTQQWCGPLFTSAGVAGTLRHDEVCLQHARAPDIALVFQNDDTTNTHGHAGSTRHDAPYPTGGGCHGGLSRYELHNFLSFGGRAFRHNTALDVPAGNVDVLPTILHLLALPLPDHLDGRPLTEALRDGPNPNDLTWRDEITASTNTDGPKTYLSRTDLGRTRYINRAWTLPNSQGA